MNRTYVTLPHGRPILMWFHTMPKAGTFVWQDKPRPIISLKFDVADNKYPEAAGQVYSYDFGTAIAGKDAKKPTKGYTFLCAIKGLTELPDFLNWTDAALWEKQDWELFWGYYPVVLSEPTPSKSDPNKTYQRIVAVHNPEAIEFDVASRKTEIANRAAPTEPLGLPKTTQTPPKQAEPTPAPSFYPQFPPKEAAPAQQVPPKEESPADVVVETIRKLVGRPGYGAFTKAYLLLQGAERIGALNEQKQRHLLALLQIKAHADDDGNLRRLVEDYMGERKQELQHLPHADAVFLLIALDKAAADDVPF